MCKHFTNNLQAYTANKDMFKVSHENTRKGFNSVQSWL